MEKLGQVVDPLFLFRDNRKLTPAEHEVGRQIIEAVTALTDQRSWYIEQSGVDPSFALPAGNWSRDAPNDFLRAYRAIADGADLDLLRLWTQAYSGFNLVDQEGGRGLSSVEDLPFEEEIARRLTAKGERFVEWWRDTTADIPPGCIINVPIRLRQGKAKCSCYVHAEDVG